MKTEVKFRDLPKKVQGFLRREAQESYNIRNEESYSINLESLHNLPEWSEATDEERLAYAEWRYREGVKYCPIRANYERISQGLFRLYCGGVIHESDKNNNSIELDNRTYALIYDGKEWAELISEPEEKPLFKVGDRPQWTPELIKQLPYGTVLRCAFFIEDIFAYNGQKIECDSAQDILVDSFYFTFKKRNRYAEIVSLPDIKEETPVIEEPKAGDMVLGTVYGTIEHTELLYYTGGKTNNGLFICSGEEYDDMRFFDNIRLPQKSEVESKAKDLWEKPGNEDLYAWEIVMQGIKWGQANPDKI